MRAISRHVAAAIDSSRAIRLQHDISRAASLRTRELAHKPAGFRTHMLVAGAAALLVGLAFSLVSRSLQSTWAAP